MHSLSNSRSWCHILQEMLIVCFAYIYTPFTLRIKQNMYSLLFNNKRARYNDKLAFITFINKNE